MTDVYKVGISLVMSGNYAQVLGVLSSHLLGINKQVKDLEGSFSKLKLAIGGALGVYAGTKTLEFLGKMAKYGDQIVHQQNLMAAAGMTQKEVAEATAKAYQISAQIQTTTIAESMRHLRELRYAFGGTDKAAEAATITERANAVMKSVGGHDYSDQVWDIVKSLEMTNKTINIDEYSSYIDTLTKLYTASGGKITPQQIFQAFKYGRTAALGWDQEFIGGALGRSIQSLGGGSGGGGGRAGPGNALMSAYQAIVGDQMTKKAAAEFGGIGLYGNKEVAGSDLFTKNPYEWVQQILEPALKAKGITSTEDTLKEISRLFPNRTASQIIGEFATQGRAMRGEESMYEKDIRLQGGAMGSGAFGWLMNHDLQTNIAAFTAQWTSLMQALGAPLVQPSIDVLKKFTNAFTQWTAYASAHPDDIANLGKGIAILGVSLVGGGAIALLAALGPVGWLAAGITGLGIVITMYGKQIDAWFNSFRDTLKSFWDHLKGMNLDPSQNPQLWQQGYTGPGFGGGGITKAAYYPGGGGGYSTGSGASNYGSSGVASNPGSSVGRTPNLGASPMGNHPMFGGSANVNAALAAGAASAGVDLAHFKAMASIESSLNPNSNWNRGTQYKGLFQIGHEEWAKFGSGNIYNAQDNAMAMARMVNAHRADFRKRFGRDPTNDELYMIHQQGMGFYSRGAMTNIGGNHYPGMRGPQSHSSFEAGWSHEIERRAAKFGLTSRPPDMYSNYVYDLWRWHGPHHDGAGSPAIPSPQGHEVHVHNVTHLDGRVIAQNTAKHMIHHGNMAGGSGRMADLALTRPHPV